MPELALLACLGIAGASAASDRSEENEEDEKMEKNSLDDSYPSLLYPSILNSLAKRDNDEVRSISNEYYVGRTIRASKKYSVTIFSECRFENCTFLYEH